MWIAYWEWLWMQGDLAAAWLEGQKDLAGYPPGLVLGLVVPRDRTIFVQLQMLEGEA